jgi:plasmid stabilization system protein ParE
MDLREIFLYISNDSPKAARVLLNTIKNRVELLTENPRLGRLGRVEGTYLSPLVFFIPWQRLGTRANLTFRTSFFIPILQPADSLSG